MPRLSCIVLLSLLAAACTTAPPAPPTDPATALLEAGERITLRLPAQLLHDHDMQEPSYDDPAGYRPIPTFAGELLLTDRRLLFIEDLRGQPAASSWLSIPFAAVARARPSRTPLLNYLVVWDAAGHADSFVVGSRDVQNLHRSIGQALATRRPAPAPPARHEIKGVN